MSSASVLSPVRSWTRSIQRPESSDWGLRFSSVASRSVSNLAISLVERARMVLVISRVSSGAWAGWWCRYRAVSRHDGVGRDGMRAGQMGYLFPPCGWILRKRPRPAWVFRELNLRVRFPPPPPKNSHNSLCTRSSSLCRRGSAAAAQMRGLPSSVRTELRVAYSHTSPTCNNRKIRGATSWEQASSISLSLFDLIYPLGYRL